MRVLVAVIVFQGGAAVGVHALAVMEDDGTGDTAFLRLTVLGLANSGKTCLINSWVNNIVPSVYTQTVDATLYYRTVRMPDPDSDDTILTVLVEVEDTYCPQFNGDKDRYNQPYNFDAFLDFSSATEPGARAMQPLSTIAAPKRMVYAPMTRCRMGFVIVFDVCDEDSLTAAKQIHDRLKQKGLKEQKVYLAANKIDRAPIEPEAMRNLAAARLFAERSGVKFVECSALEFTRVRKLFRDILEDIHTESSLWMTEAQMSLKKQEAEKGPGGSGKDCIVQ